MNLLPADIAIIRAVFAGRYMLAKQVGQLVGRSPQVIRRRARRALLPGKYLQEVRRLPNEPAAYAIGENGALLMAQELGCDVSDLPFSSSKKEAKRQWYWRHLVAANQTHIWLQLSTQRAKSGVHLIESIPEFELANPRATKHEERYRLSERFINENGKVTVLRPDYLFILEATGAPLTACYLEQDRQTESVRRIIRSKFEAYFQSYRNHHHTLTYRTQAMRVLFVVSDSKTRQRLGSMQHELRRFAKEKGDVGSEVAGLFRFARAEELSVETILDAPVWETWLGERRRFCQPVAKEQP